MSNLLDGIARRLVVHSAVRFSIPCLSQLTVRWIITEIQQVPSMEQAASHNWNQSWVSLVHSRKMHFHLRQCVMISSGEVLAVKVFSSQSICCINARPRSLAPKIFTIHFPHPTSATILYVTCSWESIVIFSRGEGLRVACKTSFRLNVWMIGFIAPYTFTTRDYRQIRRYRYSTHCTVHRYTRTRILPTWNLLFTA
jgi:hypothetical protein